MATQAQRRALEEKAEEEINHLEDIATKRERWLLRQQERKMKAAEAARRKLSDKGMMVAKWWLSAVRRQVMERSFDVSCA